MIVLDTNVLSEILKPAGSADVAQWLATQDRANVFTTVVTVAEVLYGVERLPAGKRRTTLQTAVGRLLSQALRDQVIPFDEPAARVYPGIVSKRALAGHPISQFDAVIASICRARGATLATRNTRDFENCGVTLLNPWACS
jgi:predicted nucleic acid-binding protein